jgi:hypothetical protein
MLAVFFTTVGAFATLVWRAVRSSDAKFSEATPSGSAGGSDRHADRHADRQSEGDSNRGAAPETHHSQHAS